MKINQAFEILNINSETSVIMVIMLDQLEFLKLRTLSVPRQLLLVPKNKRKSAFPQVGVPVIGFSPMNNTPVLLHANDEFLNKDIFLRGIQIYEQIIPAVANLDG